MNAKASLFPPQPPPRSPASLWRGRSCEGGAWGRVGLGAWQYPGEKEITFPPYTCLEAHGDARLERDAKGNEVIIFPLKVMLCGSPANCVRYRFAMGWNCSALLISLWLGVPSSFNSVSSCKVC